VADNSNNEKRIYRAERDCDQKKKRQEASAAAKKRKLMGRDPSLVGVPPRMNQGVKPQLARPKMIGPCYRCGEMGHLVASYPKPRNQQLYPLLKEAETASEGEHLDGVDKQKGVYVLQSERSGVLTVGVDDTTISPKGDVDCPQQQHSAIDIVEEGYWEPDDQVGSGLRCWETQEWSPGEQVKHFQRRLKSNIQFWKEVLQAP